jgi:subtilisin family serine protease
MRSRAFLFLSVALSAVLLASFTLAQNKKNKDKLTFKQVLTFENQGPGAKKGRMMVQTRGPVTDAVQAKLGEYGTIHGVIDRYNIVAMTPKGPRARRMIKSLPFVSFAEDDHVRWLTSAGTWDRDILDVVDVEETGTVGAPDPREVSETGDGVHVAVIDTGLIKRWRNFLDENRVATDLARAFMGGGVTADLGKENFHISNPTHLWERDTNSHGTSVASHVIGFTGPGGVEVDGVAPDATIIPLKVFPNGQAFTFDSRIIGAIAYVTELKDNGDIGPTVINMSLGGGAPGALLRAAINDAISEGVIVVASAGNSGEGGMGWPGAFPEVISAGATGWTNQFLSVPNPFTFWWTLDVANDPDTDPPGTGNSEEQQSFVTTFSSRAIPALGTAFGVEPQELDVLAPGLWTVAPCILPSAGAGAGTPTFCFWAGTSFSSPLTAGVAALMLDKNPSLAQADVESILKSTALSMTSNDGRAVPFNIGTPNPTTWDTTCVSGLACDPVGSGLVQADAALAAVP